MRDILQIWLRVWKTEMRRVLWFINISKLLYVRIQPLVKICDYCVHCISMVFFVREVASCLFCLKFMDFISMKGACICKYEFIHHNQADRHWLQKSFQNVNTTKTCNIVWLPVNWIFSESSWYCNIDLNMSTKTHVRASQLQHSTKVHQTNGVNRNWTKCPTYRVEDVST